MLTEKAIKILERQQYRIVGSHSAVKICGWTKHMIKGQGGCYKLKFYGIMSNQCMQMTTSMSCANRCIFCWRDYKSPVSKDWKWKIDDPQLIFDGSIHAQGKLLEGFGGNEKAIKAAYEASKNVKHVALSLNGEPIIYPRINELISIFNEKGISTFLVTNGQHPQQIIDLKPVTQLYISLDAPNEKLLKEIDKPLFSDFWERLNRSLDAMAAKKQRTAIRITMIKGYNDVEVKNYVHLIKKANADFIEIKGYMHIGASQERLSRSSMPLHQEVVAFAKQFEQFLEEYEIFSEHIPSRVVVFAKKTFKKDDKWMTWIDFPKYAKLSLKNEDFTESYNTLTPKDFVGLDPESKTIPFRKQNRGEGQTYVSVAKDCDESELE